MDQSTTSCEENYLDSKIGPDCKFLVGPDDIKEEITGHKAIFANASPVFRDMFFGSMPEKGEIKIPDIHPETFCTMMDYIYTGKVTFDSVEEAVEVWYTADKYNIGKLIKFVTNYLIPNIQPENACYILKFGILYRNKIVVKKCLEIISGDISAVLEHSSFLEVDLPTLKFILNQRNLVVSEFDLFKALVRYDKAQKDNISDTKFVHTRSTSPDESESGVSEAKKAKLSSVEENINNFGEGTSNQYDTEKQEIVKGKPNGENPVKELVKKIRFLTMTSEQFGECVAMSSFFSPFEAFNILFNITVRNSRTHPMPAGYSTKRTTRNRKEQKYYCNHANYYSIVHAPSESEIMFNCNKRIKITGLRFNESNVKHLTIVITNNQSNELLRQDFYLNRIQPLEDFVFNIPVKIDAGRYFTISIKVLERRGVSQYICPPNHICNSTFKLYDIPIIFHFRRSSDPCLCRALIKDILFVY